MSPCGFDSGSIARRRKERWFPYSVFPHYHNGKFRGVRNLAGHRGGFKIGSKFHTT